MKQQGTLKANCSRKDKQKNNKTMAVGVLTKTGSKVQLSGAATKR
jgi:hypothetical protein